MLSSFTVIKSVEFDYGHRIPHHNSVCRNGHGHRGKLDLYVEGPLVPEGAADSSEGMVIDFKEIKRVLDQEIVAKFDHRFLFAATDDKFKRLMGHELVTDSITSNEFGALMYIEGFGWIQELSCVPTAENLAYVCFHAAQGKLNRGQVRVVAACFWETPTSRACYPPMFALHGVVE